MTIIQLNRNVGYVLTERKQIQTCILENILEESILHIIIYSSFVTFDIIFYKKKKIYIYIYYNL